MCMQKNKMVDVNGKHMCATPKLSNEWGLYPYSISNYQCPTIGLSRRCSPLCLSSHSHLSSPSLSFPQPRSWPLLCPHPTLLPDAHLVPDKQEKLPNAPTSPLVAHGAAHKEATLSSLSPLAASVAAHATTCGVAQGLGTRRRHPPFDLQHPPSLLPIPSLDPASSGSK